MELDENGLLHLARREIRLRRMPSQLGSYSAGMMRLNAPPPLRAADQMIWELSTEVLASKVLADKHTFELEFPASWWQHLKRDAPRWARRLVPARIRRRCPVRMQVQKLETDLTVWDELPRANVPVPSEFGSPVRSYQFLPAFEPGPAVVTGQLSGTSPGREWAARSDLHRLLYEKLSGEAMNAEPGTGFRLAPYDAARLVIAEGGFLDQIGVNPGELVRKSALADIERNLR